MNPEWKSFGKIFVTGCLWGTIGLVLLSILMFSGKTEKQ